MTELLYRVLFLASATTWPARVAIVFCFWRSRPGASFLDAQLPLQRFVDFAADSIAPPRGIVPGLGVGHTFMASFDDECQLSHPVRKTQRTLNPDFPDGLSYCQQW